MAQLHRAQTIFYLRSSKGQWRVCRLSADSSPRRTRTSRMWAPSLDGGAESGETTPVAVQHAGSLVSAEDSALGRRLVRYVDGGIFGELDFFLRHPRSFSAVASTPDTCVQVLTRDALQSMQSQAPQLAAALEHALLKYLSFQVNAKLGLSDGVSDASRHS